MQICVRSKTMKSWFINRTAGRTMLSLLLNKKKKTRIFFQYTKRQKAKLLFLVVFVLCCNRSDKRTYCFECR